MKGGWRMGPLWVWSKPAAQRGWERVYGLSPVEDSWSVSIKCVHMQAALTLCLSAAALICVQAQVWAPPGPASAAASALGVETVLEKHLVGPGRTGWGNTRPL